LLILQLKYLENPIELIQKKKKKIEKVEGIYIKKRLEEKEKEKENIFCFG
jgi:hypothetical protein